MRFLRAIFPLAGLFSAAAVVSAQNVTLSHSTEIHGIGTFQSSGGASLDINSFVGADRFYNAGFTGYGVTQTVVDAGLAWNLHDSLSHVTTQIVGSGAAGEFDAHATWIASAMGGFSATSPSLYNGIAPNSTIWTGAVATSWNGGAYSVDFNASDASVYSVYHTAWITGVSGNFSDVTNTSWYYTEGAATAGFTDATLGLDGMIKQGLRISVAAVGNLGPGNNTVVGLAAGYNSIAVGALTSDTSSPPYSTVAPFSSRSPNEVLDATSPTEGTIIPDTRVRVDIVAPATNFNLALYSGQTGGNGAGLAGSPALGPATPDPSALSPGLAGVSFADAVVAGGATLLVEAGKTIYSSNSHAVDPRVIKAVLQNSATKIPGWTNNAHLNVSGVLETSQGVDFKSGAGALDLNRAFDQYIDPAHGGLAATADVPGTAHGAQGNVAQNGWDFGQVLNGVNNTYFINVPLHAGENFTVTLNWFVDRDPGGLDFSNVAEQRFADIDLFVFSYVGPGNHTVIHDIASSDGRYLNTEHISFALNSTAYYGLRIEYFGDIWNFTAANTVDYGLAWSYGIVPEPATAGLLSAWAALILTSAFRRHQSKTKPCNSKR